MPKFEVETRTQPHYIHRVLELPGGSPPLLQGGDAAAKEVCANCAYSEPGKPEAKDPGDGDLQSVVFQGHVAPIVAAHDWGLAQGSERLRVLLGNPAPLCSPLLPLATELTLQIRFLLADSRDPSNPSGKRLSSLYPRYEVMAEKGNTRVDSDKVLLPWSGQRWG